MTTQTPPAARDRRSRYDFRGPPSEGAPTAALSGLDELVEGEVRFDAYTRQLYATDASAYEVTPIGVVFPTSTDDVAAVMGYCAERGVPVLPRGGGTSLAGQAVNEAVVLDFTRHMDRVLDVDPDARRARAQPGITLGDLNATLALHGLKFAPDPAWGEKSALGGAIGNNSTGSHSLQYGKTDVYVESCEVVLADGTVTTFGEVGLEELRERADPTGSLEDRIHAAVRDVLDDGVDAIRAAYPALKRNVSGYNLDLLVEEADDGAVNLARLLAGSEGTLAIVTEATVSLEPVPETKAVALLTYDDLLEAMHDVAPILEHDPAAVEVMDEVLLDLARDTEEFGDVVSILPEGTNAVLLVEFYADSDDHGMRRTADLIADRLGPDAMGTAVPPSDDAAEMTGAPRRALDALEAHDPEARATFWKMRKSGNPILLSRTSDAKHISFVEDTAVPPEHLPDYVADFRDLLEDHGTFASFYAHAGPGCLHIRPLVNTKTVEGVEQMAAIADAVTDLVVRYGGSVSGEHGDGRARTQWNRKLYGDEVWELFGELKDAFDPQWLLNPGSVCGDHRLTEHLRFDPDYDFEAGFEPTLNWENENGFQGMTELCHGCGGCRGPQGTTGGVMCPTYRAADEEITATRGRANLLRQAMSGELDPDEVTSEEFVTEVLDLCIGCKGCARDCPSEVDMAKLKVEVTNAYHERHGIDRRTWLFANVDRLARVASATAPVSNWLATAPGARPVMERLLGIARERTLPTFRRHTLEDWFEARGGGAVDPDGATRRAALLPDTYTNHSHPELGRAAVEVLEGAGVAVTIPDGVGDSGRPALSKGVVDVARRHAGRNVAALAPLVEAGWDVVVAEPSDAVMLQSDYLDLLSGDDVEAVAANTYGVMEYIDRFDLEVPRVADGDPVTYHGHCHQKAIKREGHAAAVLRRAGYAVDALDSGCCGMAGSFGYEAEHYAMSRAIGSILFEQVERSDGRVVAAPGTSCRTQLRDREGDREPVVHPIELLVEDA